MGGSQAKGAKAVGWFLITLSVVLMGLEVMKISGGRDLNAALVVMAMVLLIAGVIALTRAQKQAISMEK